MGTPLRKSTIQKFVRAAESEKVATEAMRLDLYKGAEVAWGPGLSGTVVLHGPDRVLVRRRRGGVRTWVNYRSIIAHHLSPDDDEEGGN
ncbi:MAG: hypothetical protein ACLFVH_13215 [Phycisphaerae bacterium]